MRECGTNVGSCLLGFSCFVLDIHGSAFDFEGTGLSMGVFLRVGLVSWHEKLFNVLL